MKAPSSPYFTAIDLSSTFNADRDTLPDSLRLRAPAEWAFGPQTLRGMPFALGRPNTANVICLDQAPVTLPLGDVMASHLGCLHTADHHRETNAPTWANDGNPVGDH